jgi:integrase
MSKISGALKSISMAAQGCRMEESYFLFVKGFKLSIQMGVRREELVTLKWNSIIDTGNGIQLIKLDNLKVNRIFAEKLKEKSIRYVPITHGLKSLLIELGYNEKIGSDNYILERPSELDIKYVMDSLSRGFAHFIKFATNRNLQFNDLRNTYITMISKALGDKAKLYTGHTNDNTIKYHYLNQAFLQGNLGDFDVL